MAEEVGPEMAKTPWGHASTLRERRLSPGRGTPREEVRRNQRERLLAAMVAVTAAKGYAETSIKDLVEASGVSSRSFYQHFADKEECFLATMEEILADLHRVVIGELEGEGAVEERADRAARALVESLSTEPATTRLWLVESSCAGEQAQQRLNFALDVVAAQLQRIFADLGKEEMPDDLTRAILGGVSGVVYNRLSEGKAAEIAEIAKPLQAWALGFPQPPGPVRTRGRHRRAAGGGFPPFVAHVPAERVLRGFADVVAEKGYAATTVADIASRAAVSQATIYAHFKGKEDILNAALDSSGAQMIAATLPVMRRHAQWPGAVRVGAETLCAYFTAEPAFARLRQLEVYGVGPAAVRQRDRTGHELVEMVRELAPEPPPDFDELIVEATLAAVHTLLYRWIRKNGVETLLDLAPMVTYLTLAPLIGAKAAWETACG
jgi:AcrR family transcriptional regulator